MDILVLGTSNAILKGGYVDGLRAALPQARIDNRSVGASPGLQFARFLDQDLSRYDAILLDSLVNDQNYIPYIGDIEHYRTLMLKIASSLSAQSRLIAIELVNRRLFTQRSAVCDAYRSVAETLGIETLDFRTFAAARLPSLNAPDALFADENHVRPALAYRFGEAIAEAITNGNSVTRNRSYSDEFVVLRPAQSTARRQSKSNSLYQFDTALLREGDTIDLGQGLTLVGLLIDAESTRCALRLEGESVRCLNLRFNLSERLQIKFVPIRNGHPCHRMTVIAERDDYEPSHHEIRAVGAHNGAILSVNSIVCARSS